MEKTAKLNIKLDKMSLSSIVRELTRHGSLMWWEYVEPNGCIMVLNVELNGVKNQAHFTRDDERYITLIELRISTPLVTEVIESVLGIKLSYSEHGNTNHDINHRTPKVLKMEIDYHLMELHEYIQSNNTNAIDETKLKLEYLHSLLYGKETKHD